MAAYLAQKAQIETIITDINAATEKLRDLTEQSRTAIKAEQERGKGGWGAGGGRGCARGMKGDGFVVGRRSNQCGTGGDYHGGTTRCGARKGTARSGGGGVRWMVHTIL